MGLKPSKTVIKPSDKINKKNGIYGRINNSTLATPRVTKNTYNTAVVERTRQQLKTEFSTFILNQMLLGIQFWGNFESEKEQAREHCYFLEKELANRLENFSIILPNVLDEVVQRRVQFKPKHGPNKGIISKISTQKIFIIFEKLEITKRDDPNYDTIPAPISKIFIDTQHCNFEDSNKICKGFVRLRWGQMSTSRATQNQNDTIESDNNCSDSECEMQNNKCSKSVDELFMGWEEDRRKSSTNMTSTTCNTYDSLYTTKLNSHQPLYELHFNGNVSILDDMDLPNECISKVVISDNGLFEPAENEKPNENSVLSSHKDEEDELNDGNESDYSDETLRDQDRVYQEKFEMTVSYLNSKSFLAYFSHIFREKIAYEIGITEEDITNGTYREASIFVSAYEVIPALHYPHWPDCAAEWVKRQRPIHYNYGEEIQWPTPHMIEIVTSFGCHAIPVGYSNKKQKNLRRDYEWKFVFPKAERYLESQLLGTQAKIYMFCKALIKTHLEAYQIGNVRMFTLDHLRTHLFWECEENYIAWPDMFLGDVLLRFLKSFLRRLASKTLPDYFIRKRNLFANIPVDSLAKLHQIIARVIGNGVMYSTKVYRDLYLAPDFYPIFDYKKLYVTIVVKDPLLLMHGGEIKPVEAKPQTKPVKKEKKIIGNKKRIQNRKKKRREQKQEEERRPSTDTIDLDFPIENSQEATDPKYDTSKDAIRRVLVLKSFLSFFTLMAREAITLKAYNQSKIYLNHCYRLCTLLREYGQEAFESHSKTELIQIETQLITAQSKIDGPELPKRTNLEPVGSFRQHRNPLAVKYRPSDKGRFEKEGRFEKGRRSVQFNKITNSIEPRSSFFSPTDNNENQLNDSKSGILKQSSIVESNDLKITKNSAILENWKKTGTIKLVDDIEVEPDNDHSTYL